MGIVVALTLLSAYIGWRALRGDPRDAWIRSVAVAVAAIGGTSFRGATLIDVDFSRAYLKSTDFRRALLRHTRWRDVNKLDCVRPGETYLSYASVRDLVLTGAGQGQSYRELSNLVGLNLHGFNLVEADFSGCNLEGADLSWANLKGVNLSDVNLNEVNLIGIDLSCANLSGLDFSRFDLSCASLREANLSRTQMLGTKFKETILTGACLENWNINSDTNFESVICDYVYLKADQQERRPREGNFNPGEFASLFQKAVDTVDLIFKDGIDWQAFFQSFQDLRSRYADQDLSIQAIEKKRDGAFVVRVEVPPEVDKTVIESQAKELYASEVKALEAQYEERLRLQGQHLEDARQTIEVERRDKATLMAVMSTMASTQQGPKYDLRGSRFAGGFAETVQGHQVGGTVNNAAAEVSSLAEAAAEIQNLLKQLEASNPNATEADQTAYLNALIPPTRRDRFVGALKAASGASIEEVPYGAVLKALVEGWQRADG
ncbi:pentapeptide repeat-containing protein [Adonisia turfae]|nr:pentapeptide repeat-containing protein [Adonisia turfae]